jgi:HEAT repeat protein
MAKKTAGLALLISIRLVSGACAQEPKTVSPMFPPVAQLLGAEPVGARGQSTEALIKKLASPDPEDRKAALSALGRPDNMRAVPYLGGALLNLNETVDNRVAAAMSLGRVRNWRAVSYLKQAVKDNAKEVRFAAALALGKTKTKEALPVLTDLLDKDPEWWVRFAAAVALGENRDPVAVNALAFSAANEREWQVRMQAVRSLGQMGSRDAARALDKPLRDPDASVRAATAMALGDIGGLDALNMLAQALHDENDEFPRQVMSDTIKKLLSRP